MPFILVVLFVITLVLHILWTHLANQTPIERLYINVVIIVVILILAYFVPVLELRPR